MTWKEREERLRRFQRYRRKWTEQNMMRPWEKIVLMWQWYASQTRLISNMQYPKLLYIYQVTTQQCFIPLVINTHIACPQYPFVKVATSLPIMTFLFNWSCALIHQTPPSARDTWMLQLATYSVCNVYLGKYTKSCIQITSLFEWTNRILERLTNLTETPVSLFEGYRQPLYVTWLIIGWSLTINCLVIECS